MTGRRVELHAWGFVSGFEKKKRQREANEFKVGREEEFFEQESV